jgi:hypothetical protein
MTKIAENCRNQAIPLSTARDAAPKKTLWEQHVQNSAQNRPETTSRTTYAFRCMVHVMVPTKFAMPYSPSETATRKIRRYLTPANVATLNSHVEPTAVERTEYWVAQRGLFGPPTLSPADPLITWV